MGSKLSKLKFTQLGRVQQQQQHQGPTPEALKDISSSLERVKRHAPPPTSSAGVSASSSSQQQQPNDHNFRHADYLARQSSIATGDDERRVKLYGYSTPGDNVKYVSKFDYDIMRELQQDPETGRRNLDQLNEEYLKERREWRREELDDLYQTERNEPGSQEQALLRQFTGKDIGLSSAPGSQHEELTSQDKDPEFVSNVENIANQVQFVERTIDAPPEDEYRQYVGRPRARPLFEDVHGDIDRVKMPHMNPLWHNEDLNQQQYLNQDTSTNTDQYYPETFRADELKRFLDVKREMEYRHEDTTELVRQFAEDHEMDLNTLHNIIHYFNSVYIYKPSPLGEKDTAYGFWNKI